ncbi:MAG TPA: FtsK/SpoIIIE domain-containing protein [Candidatus Dormibacteraeota bacterium]
MARGLEIEGEARTDGRTDTIGGGWASAAVDVGLARMSQHRQALAAVAVAAGLALGAELGHLVNADAAWAVLPAGLALTALAANLAGRRKPYVAVAGVLVTLWVSAAWWLGPSSRACAYAWAAGTLVAVLVRSRGRSSRRRIEVIGGTWRPWEREAYAYTQRVTRALERIDAAWSTTVVDAGLHPGFQLRRLIGDRFCYSLHIEIPSGHTLDELLKARGALETALNANRETTSIEGEERARGAVIRWTQEGRQRPPLLWTRPSGTRLKHPVEIGEYEDRTPLTIPLGLTAPDSHALVTGATNSGKTTFLRLLVGELAAREDVIIWGVDVAKGGAHFRVWPNCIDRLVTEPEDVIPLLRAVSRIIRARSRWIGENGFDDWPTSPQRPQLVLIVEELSELVDQVRAAVKELESISRLGRQLGVTLILATQRSTDDALGHSSKLRSQVRLRIAFAGDSRDATATFDQGRTASRGWDPGALPGPGWVLVCSSSHPSPRQARTKLLGRERAAAEDARHAGRRPAWDEVSLEAIAAGYDPAEEATAEEPARLLPMRAVDDRLTRLWAAIEEQGEEEFSGRGLARPGLDKNWISKEGLPHFASLGRIERGPTGKWRRAADVALEGDA